MKKLISSLMVCSCFLTACSSEATTEPQTQTVEDHVPTGVPSDLPQVGEYYQYQTTGKEFPSLDGTPVDYDFTEMSATVSYSMALMMMYEPEDYWEKTYRINGTYIYQHIEEFGDVHVLLLMDETNCCTGFIELLIEDGMEHPETGTEIGVIGEYILVNNPEMPYSVLDVTQIAF